MQETTPTSAKFRRDINGLRAWAIAAVVLFHFNVGGFDGGFVGVDVFFVISGFLMTGMIVAGLESGTFSLLGFYVARARRIIPALLAMSATVMALGWLILFPPDFKQLATHVAYSVSFLSNIAYWTEAGYFDSESHGKWLLHTWSLSVEWQFYMLLPLLLWGVSKLKQGRRVLVVVLSLGMLASLAACVVQTGSNPSAAFYLLHTRAWQMLAGGLVWLVPMQRLLAPANGRLTLLLHCAGLLLIGASVACFDQTSAWPGWRAALPVAGAMLVLLARSDTPLTDNRVAQWLGDRSYSIYLWHWPVVVLLAYAELSDRPLAVALGVAASIVLGHISYHLVERPVIRYSRKTTLRRFVPLQLAAIAVVGIAAVLVWRANGVPGRLPAAMELVAAGSTNRSERQLKCEISAGEKSPSCRHGGDGRRVVVLGDSHAGALVPGLVQAGAASNAGIIQWTYSACPYVPGMKKTAAELARWPASYRCGDFVAWATATLNAYDADVPVVIVGRYAAAAFGSNEGKLERRKPSVYFSTPYATAEPAFLDEFSRHITDAACELAKQRKVFLVRPIPEMGVDVPKVASRRMVFHRDPAISVKLDDYRRRNDWIWKAQDKAHSQCKVTIIDPIPLLCPDGVCQGVRNGRSMYHDDDHLSLAGTALIAPVFDKVFQ